MAGNAFDIYQTSDGYVAVTNPVRCQILEALGEGEKELPELVELTGKAKPTLSSVHMKDLLAQRLVEAVPHPTDSRRKIFRVIAQKIGSSSVPVDTLRDAVKQYVSISPLAARFPLVMIFEVMAAAPPATDPAVLREQATALGRRVGALLPIRGQEGLIMGLAKFLEQEGLARPLRLDLEHRSVEVAYGSEFAADIPGERLGALLAGFASGVAQSKEHPGRVVLEAIDGERRCIIRFNGD